MTKGAKSLRGEANHNGNLHKSIWENALTWFKEDGRVGIFLTWLSDMTLDAASTDYFCNHPVTGADEETGGVRQFI